MSAKQFLRYWVNGFRNILYYLRNRKEIQHLMHVKGIEDVKPFNILNWHHGVSLYYGNCAELEVFIKTSVNMGELSNENKAYDILEKNKLVEPYLIKRVKFFETDFFEALILQREKGEVLSSGWILDNLNKLPSLIVLFEEFSRLNIVHRDVKLDNFLVCDDQIKIFDFTFMVNNDPLNDSLQEINLDKRENILKLLDLGHYKPGALAWDDFYSLHSIISDIYNNEVLSAHDKSLLEEFIMQCSKKIGTNRYSILGGH